jgi:hypothetical protein
MIARDENHASVQRKSGSAAPGQGANTTMGRRAELPSNATSKAANGKQPPCEFEWLLRFLSKSLQAGDNSNFRETSLQDSRLEELLAQAAAYQVRVQASATHFLGRRAVSLKEQARSAALGQ